MALSNSNKTIFAKPTGIVAVGIGVFRDAKLEYRINFSQTFEVFNTRSLKCRLKIKHPFY